MPFTKLKETVLLGNFIQLPRGGALIPKHFFLMINDIKENI